MSNYSGKYAEKKKEPLKAFLPVIGLIIIALAGAAAYFGSEPVAKMMANLDFLASAGIDAPTMRLLAGIVIVVIVVAVFSLVFAIIQPRQKETKLVSESTLKGEKDALLLEKQRAQRRKKSMQSKMKKGNKDFSEL